MGVHMLKILYADYTLAVKNYGVFFLLHCNLRYHSTNGVKNIACKLYGLRDIFKIKVFCGYFGRL